MAAVTDTLDRLRKLYLDLSSHLSNWGLELSCDKTKAMAAFQNYTGPLEEAPSTDPPVEFTDQFEYLGSQIIVSGECTADIRHRVDQARKAFWGMAPSVWNVKQLSLRTKLMVYRACVLSVLTYGCETWTVDWPRKALLEKFHMTCLRKICGIGRWDQQSLSISNDQIKACLGEPNVMQLVHQHRLRWVGHVARMDNSRLPKRMLFAFLPAGQGERRLPGRSAGKRLRDGFIESMRAAGLSETGWLQQACLDDGQHWKLATRAVALWFRPVQPGPRQTVPDRNKEASQILARPFNKPQKVVTNQWDSAQRRVSGSELRFVKWEASQEDLPATAQVVGAARKLLGREWFMLPEQDVLDALMATEPWLTQIVTSSDLVLLALMLQTESRMLRQNVSALVLSPGPPPPVRTKMVGKQTRPPGYFGVEGSVGPGVADEEAEAGQEGVPEKYWVRGSNQRGDDTHLR